MTAANVHNSGTLQNIMPLMPGQMRESPRTAPLGNVRLSTAFQSVRSCNRCVGMTSGGGGSLVSGRLWLRKEGRKIYSSLAASKADRME